MQLEDLKHLHITMPMETYIAMMRDIQENQQIYRKGDLKKYIIKAVKDQITTGNARAQITQSHSPFGLSKGKLRLKKLMQQIIEDRVQKGKPRLVKGNRLHLDELKLAIMNFTGYHDVHERALRKCIIDSAIDKPVTMNILFQRVTDELQASQLMRAK